MESIEFFHYQLSLAREIAVSHKNYILTDRIIAQIQSDNVYVDKSSLCRGSLSYATFGYGKNSH